MSGGPGAGSDDELVVVAGEYVLGTLPHEEAARLALEAGTDPILAATIADWERRLAPLLPVVSVAPPPGLWARIEASLGRGPRLRAMQGGRADGPASGAARIGLWRGLAAAWFLLAASLAGVALLPRSEPPAPVAVLAPGGANAAAYVLESHGDGSMGVVPLAPVRVPSGRDLELWALARGARVPKPLGVLPAGGMRIAAGRVPKGPVQILVSLEPEGGSPTGLPTGPVLYAGSLPHPG